MFTANDVRAWAKDQKSLSPEELAAEYAQHCVSSITLAMKQARPELAVDLVNWWKLASGEELMEALRKEANENSFGME
jgi:actin-like ATPase involved in cell morphogenesis